MVQQGVFGKGSGKVGSSVWSVSHGTQVIRQHTTKVANPVSTSQTEARAKLSLISQISAAMASVIAIPRRGNVSPRNRFTQLNAQLLRATGTEAQLPYEQIQLTDGNTIFPNIFTSRSDGNLSIQLDVPATSDIARVVYNVFVKDDSQKLSLQASMVVAEAGTERRFQASCPASSAEYVIYGYGIKDRSAKATAKFSNYEINTGQQVAYLVASRGLSKNDFTFTQTKGITLLRGANATQNVN